MTSNVHLVAAGHQHRRHAASDLPAFRRWALSFADQFGAPHKIDEIWNLFRECPVSPRGR